ncbi:MAG: hypothetical protein HWE27_15820 [Gammaproteobacteria bacterium]|nr:hypothetical protein [Gammaproteobacteria bacterium]
MERVVDLQYWQTGQDTSEYALRALFEQVKSNYNEQPYPEYQQRVDVLKQLKAAPAGTLLDVK